MDSIFVSFVARKGQGKAGFPLSLEKHEKWQYTWKNSEILWFLIKFLQQHEWNLEQWLGLKYMIFHPI